MTKLTYGKKDQVKFLDESEKIEAINYLKSSSNVVTVLEHNEEQGAWGSEKRFIIKDDDPNMPVGVRRNLTAGYKGCFGRINCKELYDEIID
ncbi:hypothetical protein [Streptococcus sanguinis]|jgi:hypothetical protein|uniref:Uncharacterized protein n=1 Tax=Streptococcus sanguinis SK355 TaxID=888816 RepID=F3UT80_STRSA|nr:hypothetical protein [Streptococcus sanguinis]EGJ36469.1 hypothetical protein HMPREF9389_2038 [Streptococcus sanguinis SK355]